MFYAKKEEDRIMTRHNKIIKIDSEILRPRWWERGKEMLHMTIKLSKLSITSWVKSAEKKKPESKSRSMIAAPHIKALPRKIEEKICLVDSKSTPSNSIIIIRRNPDPNFV